jgi:hypothetical protein
MVDGEQKSMGEFTEAAKVVDGEWHDGGVVGI